MREAGAVAQWVNALDIEGVYLRAESLAHDLKDGTALLQVINVVEPGLVNFARVNLLPGANRYKRVENCNYVINLGRAMDFHLTNVAGLDIVDGNQKLVLAFMWQLMRYATLKQLSKLAFDGFAADDGEVLRWANERVTAAAEEAGHAGADVRVASFADPSLSNGYFLLYLLNSIRPIVNWALVSSGATTEEQVSNAMYVLSVARRLGAQVVCTHHDIVDARAKPIMLLVASVMVAESRARQGLASGSVGDEGDAEAHGSGDEGDGGDDDDDSIAAGGAGGGGGRSRGGRAVGLSADSYDSDA